MKLIEVEEDRIWISEAWIFWAYCLAIGAIMGMVVSALR